MNQLQFVLTLRGYIGKYIDYDNTQGFQCTDFGKQGLTILTGKRFGTMGNAIDWWRKPVQALKDVATAVSGSNAKAGDLVIKTPNHLGWATGNINATQVEIIEQNGHTGTGKKADGNQIRTRWISRSQVAGLWRPKALHEAASTPTKTYTVVKGDTLSGIGAKTGVAWKTIASLNGISSPYIIRPGQVLKLS
jgi:LysM repeat protein